MVTKIKEVLRRVISILVSVNVIATFTIILCIIADNYIVRVKGVANPIVIDLVMCNLGISYILANLFIIYKVMRWGWGDFINKLNVEVNKEKKNEN